MLKANGKLANKSMNPIEEINERVGIVPIFYAEADEQSVCMPWKMRYRGREIIFTKLGMRHPTEKGKRMIHAFNMSDGTNDYRIELDAGLRSGRELCIK